MKKRPHVRRAPLTRSPCLDVRNEEQDLRPSGLTAPKKKAMEKFRIDGAHTALGEFSIFAKESTRK